MAVTADGATLYVAAFGSSAVGVFDTGALENDTFVPDAARPHRAERRRPDRPRARRGARPRSTSSRASTTPISVVDTDDARRRSRTSPLHKPEPAAVVDGRPLPLRRAADVEQRRGVVLELPRLRRLRQPRLGPRQPRRRRHDQPAARSASTAPRPRDFHPLKGPMTTQSLRGMANHGSMHWRGDRTGGNDPRRRPVRRGRRVQEVQRRRSRR